MRYSELLGLGPQDVVAIVGSGGKTSLLFRLAEENRARRVLVSTTTKMFCPTPGQAAGIDLLHGGEIDGKITAPPMERLAAASAEAELTLLECDGSKELPLKGWADHEPLIPAFVSVTVGGLPLWALGMPVDGWTVHRIEQFCRLTGASPGEPVRMEAQAQRVCSRSLAEHHRCGKSLLDPPPLPCLNAAAGQPVGFRR